MSIDFNKHQHTSTPSPEIFNRGLSEHEKIIETTKIVEIFLNYQIQTPEDLNSNLKDICISYGKVMNPDIKLVDEELISELFNRAVLISLTEKLIQPDLVTEVLKKELDYAFSQTVKDCIENPRLEAATKYLEEKTAEIRTVLSKTDGPISIPTVVIGAGDAATQFWLDMKDKQESAPETDAIDQSKKKPQLPSTVLLAKDTGSWKHTYTLAQRYSTLERGGSPSNPLAYAERGEYEEDRHVNASCLYKSNLVNLAETNAPVCLGTSILKVERKDKKHTDDWEIDSSPNRVSVKLELEHQEKEVNLSISGQSIDQLFDELKITEGKLQNQLIDFFLVRSGVEINSVSQSDKFQSLTTVLSTDTLLNLAKDRGNFEEIKKELNLAEDVSQFKFAQALQNFLRNITDDTLNSQLKESASEIRILNSQVILEKDKNYTELTLATDSKGIPKMIDGKVFIEFKVCITKQIYTNKLNVCAGFGVARLMTTQDDMRKASQPIPKQISQQDLKQLGYYDVNLGFTPVIDGNTFMLSDTEEGKPEKDIIIYGGGGNATACYRKAFFGTDEKTELKSYDKESQSNKDIKWFARTGFEEAGYGKLAGDALTYAIGSHAAFAGELVRVESLPDGKVAVYMKDAVGTYENKQLHYTKQEDQNFPVKLESFPLDNGDNHKLPSATTIPVRKFICDQFVYTIGQEKKPLTELFPDFDPDKGDTQVWFDTSSGMPLGVESRDGTIKFWGATAGIFSPSMAATAETRKENVKEAIEEAAKAQLRAEIRYSEAARKIFLTKENSEERNLAVDEFAIASLEKYKTELLIYKAMEYESRLKLTERKTEIGQRDTAIAFNENLRDWITIQRIARDAEWPGVMPTSRVTSMQTRFIEKTGFFEFGPTRKKLIEINIQIDELEDELNVLKNKSINSEVGKILLAEKEAQLNSLKIEKDEIQKKFDSMLSNWSGTYAEAIGEFEHANINLDDIEYLNAVLINAGVTQLTLRLAFLTCVLKEREKAYQRSDFPGISEATLKIMIHDFGLQRYIEVIGRTSLKIKEHAKKEEVLDSFRKQISIF